MVNKLYSRLWWRLADRVHTRISDCDVGTFGTVDVLYMLHEWNLASKATYRGARVAIVSNPAALGLSNPAYTAGNSANLALIWRRGRPTGDGQLSDLQCDLQFDELRYGTLDAAAFAAIVTEMQQIFPRLQPTNVQVRYQTTGLGFSGRPGGLPMTVTVSIQCMSHQMFFLGAVGWLGVPACNGLRTR